MPPLRSVAFEYSAHYCKPPCRSQTIVGAKLASRSRLEQYTPSIRPILCFSSAPRRCSPLPPAEPIPGQKPGCTQASQYFDREPSDSSIFAHTLRSVRVGLVHLVSTFHYLTSCRTLLQHPPPAGAKRTFRLRFGNICVFHPTDPLFFLGFPSMNPPPRNLCRSTI